MGKDPTKVIEKLRGERKTRGSLKAMLEKEKRAMQELEENDMDIEDNNGNSTRDRTRSRTKSRGAITRSLARDASKHRSPSKYDEASERIKRVSEKRRKFKGMIGDADRRIIAEKPKHLFAGKQDFKRDRR